MTDYSIGLTLSMSIVDLGEFFPGNLPGNYVGYMNEPSGNEYGGQYNEKSRLYMGRWP